MKSTDKVIEKAKIAATNNMTLPSDVSANYMYIEPNSHFFGDLEQIKHSLELGVSREHIIIGLDNTIKRGYNLTQELDCE